MLLLLCGLWAGAQPFPELRFVQLTDRDGLSCDKASGIAQDSDGVIWISTSNGLNRFDGYGFSRWFANPDDTTTLLANEIENIAADRKNNLWMMTAGGICRFNTITRKASHFRSGASNLPVFRSFDNSGIWFGDNGDPYIVSSTGLYHFTDTGHYTAMEEGFAPFVRQDRSFTHYANLVSDKQGGLWAYQQNVICRVNSRTKKVERSFALGKDVAIYDMLFDSHNHCWASTWSSGLLRIDADGACSPISGDFSHTVIRQGVEWRLNGRSFLVFATSKPGLLMVDAQTGTSRYYFDDKELSGIGTPFVDRQNILWVPTTKGVIYVNSAGSLFDLIPLHIFGKDHPDGTDLTTSYDMREERSGYWIARRYDGGMIWFDKDWRLIHGWPRVVDSLGPIYRKEFGTLKEAYDFRQVGDEMFISTEWGMMIMDLKTLRRTMIRYTGNRQIMRLRTIVPEDEHTWWIRSFDQGVFVFDPIARRFTRHYLLVDKCTDCGMLSANYLIRDHRGNMFATTNGGLFQYDRQVDSFLLVNPAGGHSMGSSLIGLAEDSAGLIWVGLDDGICAYDPATGRIVRVLSERNSIGPVARISIDKKQNVWFRSSSGYWCWLRRQDKIIQFRFSQDLPDNDEGFFYTASNGDVYAGCMGGVVRFHADRLMDYNVAGTAKIMDAFAGDKALDFIMGPRGERRLTLGPNQNNLQVNFDVINYDLPENNLFFYKLAPGSGDWVQLENGRLSFNNLPAGEYELTVRGGNKITGGFMPTDRLIFVIKPFWYQSWWFKSLVALALLGLLVVLVRMRIRRIRQEAAFRQKMADTELQALRAQMNPHFIFNSLNSIENFIMKNEKWLASDYLNKFARLFRMILNSSRNELVPFPKDMEALQLYIDLEKLRYNNKFEYEARIDPQLMEGEYRVPSMLIQPYVENAIIHGIGLSERKDLCVLVTAFLSGDYIHYQIQDNGIGRRRAQEVRQMNRPNHRSVGLAITENRIHIFSHQQHSEGSVHITDLSNEDGSAAGTKVEVMIKAV